MTHDTDEAEPGILSRPYRWVMVGMLAMIVLTAFEALAVTTVMPTISSEFDGAALYALAFSGPLAVGVVGMVVAGNWSDRAGPKRALFVSVGLFAGGLLIAGFAVSMPMLVAGRLISGLGAGGLTVALFVLVARVFPESLHPRVFAAFAAAWVIPSLVGPFIAGVVAQTVGWRWVFLGVVVLVLLAMLTVVPVMRTFSAERTGTSWGVSRIVWSLVAALAVLGASLAGQASGALVGVISVGAIVVAVVSLRPLLPPGALRLARGLPSVIVLRGVVAGAYFASDTYLPYFFTSQYGFAPALAGLSLSVAGVSWAFASWAASRYAAHVRDAVLLRCGVLLVLVAIAGALGCSIWGLPAAIAVTGWVFGGAGMGLVYPRLSAATLRLSAPHEQGFNSAALTISDSTGAALALAVTAGIFATFGSVAGASSSGVGAASGPIDVLAFTFVFVLSALLGLVALVVAGRVSPRHADAPDVSG